MEDKQIKKLRMLEKYATIIWPVQRLFLKKYLSPRCKSCSISEKFTSLKNGLCEECCQKKETDQSTSSSNYQNLADSFDALMQSAQGSGKNQYDVLLLLSGGKDSAYLLHELKRKFPRLRILTYTVDNGFFSPVARENILNLVKKMEVDHIFTMPKVELFREGFRYALNHLNKKGCSEVVDQLDGDLLHDMGRHMAATHKIPFLLSGVSWAQVENIFKVKDIEMPREKELIKRETTGEIKIQEVFSPECLSYWWDPNKYQESDVARFVFPFYAWRLDEEEIKQKVIEWGLLNPKNISPLVTNNALIPVMGIVDIHQIGYSSFEPEFAKMIRQGKANRKLWKHIFEINEYVGKTGWLLGNDVKDTLKKLQIQPKQIGLNL